MSTEPNPLIQTEYSAILRGAAHRPKTAQNIVTGLGVGDEVYLEAEPTNAHDPNAIMVMADDEHIGYIARDTAEIMIDDFNASTEYTCVVDYFMDPLTPVFTIALFRNS